MPGIDDRIKHALSHVPIVPASEDTYERVTFRVRRLRIKRRAGAGLLTMVVVGVAATALIVALSVLGEKRSDRKGSPAPQSRISVPANPCDLVTNEDIEAATGRAVVQKGLVPDEQRLGPFDSEMCEFRMGGKHRSIVVLVFPSGAAKEFDRLRERSPENVYPVEGVGDEAFSYALANLYVRVDDAYFILGTRAAGWAGIRDLQEIARAALAPETEERYEANAFVLDSPETGTVLCVGSVVDTGVPQCLDEGVVPLEGWTWDAIEPEGTLRDARWGHYHVVGTFDGSKFTLTEPPGAFRAKPFMEEPACPEPEGGWAVPRPDASAQSDLERTSLIVDDEPDFAGLWADRSDPDAVVLNVAFTGHLAEHEARIRRTWGGPLCVVRFDRSLRDLHAIQRELETAAIEIGLQPLSSGTDMARNHIDLVVIVATQAEQRAMDERFGEGAVDLNPAIEPL